MKKQLMALLAAMSVLGMAAVPAKRTPFEAMMADGTTIQAHTIGDEHGSVTLDSEGNILLPTDKGYAFGKLAADGAIVASERAERFNGSRFASLRRAKSARRARAAAPAVGTFPNATFPTSGKQKALVVLVQFADKKMNLGSKSYQYFHDMLNKSGFDEYGGTGCAHDYFLEQSSGKFDCDFDVYGPITLKNKSSYYGKNDSYGDDEKAYEMAIEACQQLDDSVNFKDYDRDGDGMIDNIFIFYAGLGEATKSTQPNLVWPHAYYVSECTETEYYFDGVKLDSYGCTNEWLDKSAATTERPDGVGTFVHEFSHILGLPDLYMTEEVEGETGFHTPGEWSVLDYGPYNNDGCTPPSYSAYERNALGWIDLEELTNDTESPLLVDIQASNHAYSISNPSKANEFYLLECRRRTGWDAYLPGDGMLVWHIDYNSTKWYQNSVNNNSSHSYVDLVEADGVKSKKLRDAGDVFPGSSKVTSLSPKWWNGKSTGLNLTDIKLNGDRSITFALGGESTETPSGGNDNPTVTEPEGEYKEVLDVAVYDGVDKPKWTVRGFIVGYVNNGNWAYNGVTFGNGGSGNVSNIVLADEKGEDDLEYCIPVQLKSGAARTELNLKDNPQMLGQRVEISGTVESYCGVMGLKGVTDYKLVPYETVSGAIEFTTSEPSEPMIYDLQGRRVTNPGHGLYIINGHKVLLR